MLAFWFLVPYPLSVIGALDLFSASTSRPHDFLHAFRFDISNIQFVRFFIESSQDYERWSWFWKKRVAWTWCTLYSVHNNHLWPFEMRKLYIFIKLILKIVSKKRREEKVFHQYLFAMKRRLFIESVTCSKVKKSCSFPISMTTKTFIVLWIFFFWFCSFHYIA